MSCLLIAAYFILAVVGLFGTILILINRQVHKEMTLTNCKQWDYSTYKWFRINFARHEWKIDRGYGSVFDYATDSECHASIIRFDSRGMVLGPIDFLRSQIYLKRYAAFKRDKGLWKEGYQKLESKTLRIIK